MEPIAYNVKEAAPPSIFPTFAHLVLYHVAVSSMVYDDGAPAFKEHVAALVSDDEAEQSAVEAAIEATVGAGYVTEPMPGHLLITPSGLETLREAGPFPRHLAHGAILG